MIRLGVLSDLQASLNSTILYDVNVPFKDFQLASEIGPSRVIQSDSDVEHVHSIAN